MHRNLPGIKFFSSLRPAKRTTTDCKLIWDLIKSIPDEKLRNELSDAFCDFECSWSEHESEYHR